MTHIFSSQAYSFRVVGSPTELKIVSRCWDRVSWLPPCWYKSHGHKTSTCQDVSVLVSWGRMLEGILDWRTTPLSIQPAVKMWYLSITCLMLSGADCWEEAEKSQHTGIFPPIFQVINFKAHNSPTLSMQVIYVAHFPSLPDPDPNPSLLTPHLPMMLIPNSSFLFAIHKTSLKIIPRPLPSSLRTVSVLLPTFLVARLQPPLPHYNTAAWYRCQLIQHFEFMKSMAYN